MEKRVEELDKEQKEWIAQRKKSWKMNGKSREEVDKDRVDDEGGKAQKEIQRAERKFRIKILPRVLTET